MKSNAFLVESGAVEFKAYNNQNKISFKNKNGMVMNFIYLNIYC